MKKAVKIILLLIAVLIVRPGLAIIGIIYSRRRSSRTRFLPCALRARFPILLAQRAGGMSSTGPQYPSLILPRDWSGRGRTRTLRRWNFESAKRHEHGANSGDPRQHSRIQPCRKLSASYLEFATDRSYYLASACQTLEMLPKSEFHLHGMMAYTTFLRGTFDKLGIYPDFLHIGDYKNATNVFTEKKFTAAHREATKDLLDDWYEQFVQGVADSRNLKPADVGEDYRRRSVQF